MSKRNKHNNCDDQLSLFQRSDHQTVIADIVKSFPRLDKLFREDRLERMCFTSKEEYYQSPQWQSKRLQKIRQVGNKCEWCGKNARLDVHHVNYDSLYDEYMEDLQALCRSCHEIADGNREDASAFNSYLNTKYGEGRALGHDSEYEYEEFCNWRERKDEYW